jgi:hypothetical protein
LCRQMLAYSGRGRFVLAGLDLNHLVQEMVELEDLVGRVRAALGPTKG